MLRAVAVVRQTAALRPPCVESSGDVCPSQRKNGPCKRGDMPKGWVNLLTHWAPRQSLNPATRLCPEHARELEGLLKDRGHGLGGGGWPVGGLVRVADAVASLT